MITFFVCFVFIIIMYRQFLSQSISYDITVNRMSVCYDLVL